MKKGRLIAAIIVSLVLIVLLASLVLSLSKEQRLEIKDCKKSCILNKKQSYVECKYNYKECRTECKNSANNSKERRECYKECRQNVRECKANSRANYTECRNECKNLFAPVPLSNQTLCEENNGFFHQICNGPYFDIVCSASKYCICEGINDYSCPENYNCDKNIKHLLPRKGRTIRGYKDLLGNKLGNIGVCSEIK